MCVCMQSRMWRVCARSPACVSVCTPPHTGTTLSGTTHRTTATHRHRHSTPHVVHPVRIRKSCFELVLTHACTHTPTHHHCLLACPHRGPVRPHWCRGCAHTHTRTRTHTSQAQRAHMRSHVSGTVRHREHTAHSSTYTRTNSTRSLQRHVHAYTRMHMPVYTHTHTVIVSSRLALRPGSQGPELVLRLQGVQCGEGALPHPTLARE